jgi:hypothetical protein
MPKNILPPKQEEMAAAAEIIQQISGLPVST